MHPAETPKPEARGTLDLGTHGRDRERLTWGTFSGWTLGHRQATLESHVGFSWHFMGFYDM